MLSFTLSFCFSEIASVVDLTDEPFFLNNILTHVTKGLRILCMVVYFRGCECAFHPRTF